ncbi:hypothetical protein PV334_00440 [Streptomyces sp. ME02-7008A-1]|uniref:hypothetical protein n=1 Tax=unclassified Streptomyces TaxID=2593676 RepID=UPI0029BEB5CA|nr:MULTISPECIES: hypothetical protein [unclassified Streptomyces]MDX3179735.1 hypothetical protein [Streptomyces sp. ME02-7008A-1]MDX3300476.1 hypothetical protein [Streptomyces sp. ME02-7008A]
MTGPRLTAGYSQHPTSALRFDAQKAAVMIVLPGSDRGTKRILRTFLLAATVLIVVGPLTEALWLLGIGAWMLIGALLIELIYRP